MTDKLPEMLFPVGTDVVELPSRGQFYTIDHPLHGQNAVEIYHMRGQEEDILTNLDYLKRGLTLDKLVQSLLINSELKKSIFYDSILAADRNAILLAARITAYTWEYPVNIRCSACGVFSEYNFDLRQRKDYAGYPGDGENVQYIPETNNFVLLFDNGIVVTLRPKTVDVENKIAKKLMNKKKKDVTNKDLYEDLIVNINGISHPKIIDSFFNQVPAKVLNWFKTVVGEINPDIDLTQNYICKECGHDEQIDPPFTTDFLFPNRKRKKPQ